MIEFADERRAVAFERYLKCGSCCVRQSASAIVRSALRAALDAGLDMADPINVGRLAEEYLAGRVSFADFMHAAPEDPEDEEVAELIDLIEHEPKRGGFLGVSAGEHDRHMARIRELAHSIIRRESVG